MNPYGCNYDIPVTNHPNDPRNESKPFDIDANVCIVHRKSMCYPIVEIEGEEYVFAEESALQFFHELEFTFDELFKFWVADLFDEEEHDPDFVREQFAESLAAEMHTRPSIVENGTFYQL